MRRKATSPCPPRCFLTWRIEYFRARAQSAAFERKLEELGFQTHPCGALPQGCQKAWFSPLYGTFRGYFSSRKWPSIEISVPWIGRSMGWKWKSMGCFGRTAAWTHKNLPKRRTTVGVRFNALPYSAQGFAALPAAGAGAEKGVPRFATEHPFTEFI